MKHHHEIDAISKKLTNILTSVMDKFCTLLDMDRFYAAVLDPRDEKLTFPFVWKRMANGETNGLKAGYTREISDKWFLDALFQKNLEPIRIEKNFQKELKKKKLKFWPENPVPKSVFAFPIQGEHGVQSFLVAENFRKEEAFGHNGDANFTTISQKIALTIENERLKVKNERKALLMEEVAKLGSELASKTNLSIPDLLKMIHVSASNIMDTDNMYIALYHPDPNNPDKPGEGILNGRIDFDLMYVGGERMAVASRSPIEGEHGRTEEIILTRKPILIRTKKESEAWYKKKGKKEFIGNPLASWVGVPILRENKVFGVIATYHEKLNYLYDEDDQAVLSMMVDSAKVAMQNIELFGSLKQRTEQLQSLNESLDQKVAERTQQLKSLHDIGIKITSENDLQKVIDAIVKDSKDLTRADVATILTYDSDNQKFGILARDGKYPTVPPVLPVETGNTVKLVNSGEPIFIEKSDDYKKQLFKEVGDKKIKAAAGIPLKVKQRIVGVLWLNYLKKHPFPEEEKNLISMLANQAAIAIDNAFLYEKTRRQEKEKFEQKFLEYVQILTGELSHKMTNVLADIPKWVRKTKEYIGNAPDGEEARQWQDNIRADFDALFSYSGKIADLCKQMVVPPNKQFFPLKPAIEEAMHTVRQENRNIKILEEFRNDQTLNIFSFREDLVMALCHIIKNAVQAMDGKGKLVFDYLHETGAGGKNLILTVKDFGPGISKEVQGKIFLPYFTTRQKDGGTGLGLFLAKMRIERMGGTIAVESSPGQGSTFTITLFLAYDEIQENEKEVSNG